MRGYRATFVVLSMVLPLAVPRAVLADDGDLRPAGPMIGRLTPYTAQVWARLPALHDGDNCRLLVKDMTDKTLSRWNAAATVDNDWCVVWNVQGLRPSTEYSYRIRQNGNLVFGGEALTFTTPCKDDEPAIVRLGFGSCSELDSGSSAVFSQVMTTGCDAMVLLGDTPYIDSTDLSVQRRKHREFLRIDGLRQLARCRSIYSTWDDHDYGGSDADGNLEGKARARQAISEYRAHAPYGKEGEGIYSSFRHGPVEVFLLDTRYFANTEASQLKNADGQRSMLGSAQWQWLTDGLCASTAAVKVLACGTVWHDMPDEKTDCWARYSAEREQLFRFIGDQSISGVVLVSGDLHQSRMVEHQTFPATGYSLIEFVSSPIHTHVEPQAHVAHPGLMKHWNSGNLFLQLEVDTLSEAGTLTGRFIDRAGKVLHEEVLAIALLQKGD